MYIVELHVTLMYFSFSVDEAHTLLLKWKSSKRSDMLPCITDMEILGMPRGVTGVDKFCTIPGILTWYIIIQYGQ